MLGDLTATYYLRDCYIFIMKSYTGYNNRKKKKKLGMCKPQLISAQTNN